MKKIVLLTCLLGLMGTLVCLSSAASGPAKKDAPAVPVVEPGNAAAMRVQGEQRFRTNCGRCHAAPQKFPPRMMGTVLRHMRVRALITADDARLVLFYMTQ
jgi:cytochrome c5